MSQNTMSQNTINVPDDFYCPITGDLMNEPVLGKDGHSYEKSEILKWLSTNSTSPMTREPLTKDDLVDNLPLKRSIEAIRDRLKEEQLKIDARISEEVMIPFVSALDEIKLNSYYLDNKLFVNIDVPNVEQRPPVDIALQHRKYNLCPPGTLGKNLVCTLHIGIPKPNQIASNGAIVKIGRVCDATSNG